MKVWHDGKSHDWQEDALHESLSALFDAARTKASRLARRPVVDVLRVLDELATFWRDADSELYQNALTTLPQTTGFSRAMVKKGLDLLPHRLSGRALERKLDSELPGASGIHPGTFHEQAGHTTFYTPLGVVFHVLSGNVFLSGVSSFLEGALTRNVNIFKLASAETEFMPIFLESLRRVDTEGVLWPFQACLELPSKRHDLLAIAKTSADGIVV